MADGPMLRSKPLGSIGIELELDHASVPAKWHPMVLAGSMSVTVSIHASGQPNKPRYSNVLQYTVLPKGVLRRNVWEDSS